VTSEQKRNLSPSRIGVKYCGGCNPGYDRGSLVARIQDALSTKIEMVSLEEEADLIIAIQGCPTACADLSPFDPSKVFHIKSEEDVQLLIRKLFEDRPV
jgi:ferredoxin